jgi:hypothetical protein
MKRILLIAIAFVSTLALKAQDQKPEDVIKVSSERFDFGKVKQGIPVTTTFEITNKSNKTIYLENVSASCGCTTPEWSKEPIPAGGSTRIKVGYNSAALNHFEKDVTIKVAGIQQPKIVKITGNVMEASAYDAMMKDVKAQEAKKSTEVAKAKSVSKAAPKKTKVKSK